VQYLQAIGGICTSCLYVDHDLAKTTAEQIMNKMWIKEILA